VERQPTRGQGGDLGLVRIQAKHVEAELGQARGVSRAQIAGAKDRDARWHGRPSLCDQIGLLNQMRLKQPH
jgi:hypothetical protein